MMQCRATAAGDIECADQILEVLEQELAKLPKDSLLESENDKVG
jgi:hypothetical protein